MNVLIRVDASSLIGHGHVMRCLTLASEMRCRGAIVTFACQELPGDARDIISAMQMPVLFIALGEKLPIDYENEWPSALQKKDAEVILNTIESDFDIVIVDHYGLGCVWESSFKSKKTKIVSVDDLASRRHNCDYLLDSGAARVASDYEPYLSNGGLVKMLLGPRYALLRDEFKKYRECCELDKTKTKKLLVSMGGGETENITLNVLKVLIDSEVLSKFGLSLTVVLPGNSPWYEDIRQVLSYISTKSELLIGTSRMAEIMSESCVAIGSGGLTALERCCIGLPSVIVVRSENQRSGAIALEALGAAVVIDSAKEDLKYLPTKLTKIMQENKNKQMRQKCLHLVDGLGATRVADIIFEK